MDANLIISIALLLVFSLPMLIISIVLLSGHGASLLAGFNTMSKAERATWNEKAMSRFMGVILLVFTLLIGASFLGAFVVMELLWGALVAAIGELIFGVIYMNKSKRFRN